MKDVKGYTYESALKEEKEVEEKKRRLKRRKGLDATG